MKEGGVLHNTHTDTHTLSLRIETWCVSVYHILPKVFTVKVKVKSDTKLYNQRNEQTSSLFHLVHFVFSVNNIT